MDGPWWWRWLQDSLRDFRFAGRVLAKRPGFTCTAIFTLALGIGSTTAIFSLVEAALLRPLAVKQPDRLVVIWDNDVRAQEDAQMLVGYDDFEEYRSHAHLIDAVSAAGNSFHTLGYRGVTRRWRAALVTGSFFETAGVSAELGRTFTENDRQQGCSVVLEHGLWNTELGANRSVIGETLLVDQKPCVVLGVMPLRFALYPDGARMWILITPTVVPKAEQLRLAVLARLKPGVALAKAKAELASLHHALHQIDGKERDREPGVDKLHDELTYLVGSHLRDTLIASLAAVLLVLLIACLNLGSSLAARLSERQREFVVRAALGSGQARLVRQVLTENMLLSATGAGLGVLIAVWAIRYFRTKNVVTPAGGAEIAMNFPVLLFAALLSIATTLAFALWPAFQAARADLACGLRSAGNGLFRTWRRCRLAQSMAAVEMAFSFVLLVTAVLLMSSALRMRSEPLGFRPEGATAMRIMLPMPAYAAPGQRIRFFNALLEKLQSLPGVVNAALADDFSFFDSGDSEYLEIPGRVLPPGAEIHDVNDVTISPGFFDVLEIPLRRGRQFDSQDSQDSPPVAIVSEALVREYFPAGDPLGQQIRLAQGDRRSPWLTIVGVVGTTKHVANGMRWSGTAVLYRPLAQNPISSAEVGIRVAGDTSSAGHEMQKEITALDPSIPLDTAETLDERVARLMLFPKFRANALSLFALGALLLSAVGLHGVLAQLVTQRTPEFGVRRTVGAQTSDLLLLVARQGGIPVLGGLASGLICTLAVRRALASRLYGIEPADPATIALVSLVLLAVAAIAIGLPARRAARIDPVVALRHE